MPGGALHLRHLRQESAVIGTVSPRLVELELLIGACVDVRQDRTRQLSKRAFPGDRRWPRPERIVLRLVLMRPMAISLSCRRLRAVTGLADFSAPRQEQSIADGASRSRRTHPRFTRSPRRASICVGAAIVVVIRPVASASRAIHRRLQRRSRLRDHRNWSRSRSLPLTPAVIAIRHGHVGPSFIVR